MNEADYFYHQFGLPKEEKIKEINGQLKAWGYKNDYAFQ